MVKIHSTIANSSKFKKILESFKDIIGEAFFEFKEDGLYIKSIDSSHITLLVLVLKPQFFKDYSNLKSYDFVINFQNLAKVLHCSEPGDTIMIRLDLIQFLMSIILQNSVNRITEYELKLLNRPYANMDIPVCTYDISIEIDTQEMVRLCKELSIIGDVAMITVHPGVVVFTARGITGRAIVLYKSNSLSKESKRVIVQGDGKITQSLSLKFLVSLCKIANFAKSFKISLRENYPVKIECLFENLGFLQYYLAPKLKNNY